MEWKHRVETPKSNTEWKRTEAQNGNTERQHGAETWNGTDTWSANMERKTEGRQQTKQCFPDFWNKHSISSAKIVSRWELCKKRFRDMGQRAFVSKWAGQIKSCRAAANIGSDLVRNIQTAMLIRGHNNTGAFLGTRLGAHKTLCTPAGERGRPSAPGASAARRV